MYRFTLGTHSIFRQSVNRHDVWATENDGHSVNMPSTASRVSGNGNHGIPATRCSSTT